MGSEWVFYHYVDAADRDLIEEWLVQIGPKARARFANIIWHLEATPLGDWGLPYVRFLTGDCAELWEIRMPLRRVQHRPLGCFGPGALEANVLFGAREISDVFEPPMACTWARERKADIFANPIARRRQRE